MNAIDAAIRIVRSDGPVGLGEIATEIQRQANGVWTREAALRAADRAIRHGLEAGWLARYDDVPDAYVMMH